MKNLLLVISIFVTLIQNSNYVFAQNYTLSGYIKDSETGETLIGANVYNTENFKQGTSTNVYGFYSLSLPKGIYSISVQYVGYQTISLKIDLNQNIRKNIDLLPEGTQLQEVVVVAERQDENVQSTEMGTIDVEIEKIKSLPVLFGEVDILKTIQLLPGVQSSGEGNTGFYVRGGGPDQNLVLLDEAVVYNPGHLFGFFSVFNADALKNTTLIKGGMPANYGGRLSSVLDITMKDGNNKSYHAQGGIGLISSRLLIEGPIVKNKSSFMITGRRTYIDQLAKPFLKDTELGGIPYYFYDLNAKANYIFSDKDRLYVSGYFGRDVAKFKVLDGRLEAGFDWGNATSTVRWNHLFSDKLFFNLSAVYNKYDFEANTKFDNFKSTYFSGIQDYNSKLDFTYFPSIRHEVKFGLNYTYHQFTPRSIDVESGGNDLFETEKKKKSHESAVYLMDIFELNDKISINAGIRGVYFIQPGPFTKYQFNELDQVTDSTVYKKGEIANDFFGLEPRFSFRYKINKESSIKAGYSYNHQFIHLVSNSYTSLPLDIWVPSSVLVKPQIAQQYSIGYFRNFKENMFETSVEIYYKSLQNQIEYGESYIADQDVVNDIEYEFVFGKGVSYGIELFFKKRLGKVNGWIGYTLSKTDRQFDDIDGGITFPARFDRRHDVSFVLSYEYSKKWIFATTFVYGTGQAITMPERVYLIEGNVVRDYGKRNSFRMEAYHRMDLSATMNFNQKGKLKHNLVFAVYNTYNRANPFFYYVNSEVDNNSISTRVNKVYIFPILPSITWNFEF